MIQAALRHFTTAGLSILVAFIPGAAAEPPGELVREILREVGATVRPCPPEALEAFSGRELLCAEYPRKFSFFKLDWETTLGQYDIKTQVVSASSWMLREGRYVREYEAGEAKLTVSFDEAAGSLIAAFTLPDDPAGDAALVAEEGPSSRAGSRDTLPLAGFGGVSTPVLVPESRVEPEMPERAAALELEGRVTLRVLVLSDGSVGEVRVLRVEPEGWGFGEAAAEAVAKWRYEPARREDEPVDAWFTVYHEFKPL